MNGHSLPDDVRRWPTDPFELLGVARNVPPRELKRAYTCLIRAYKPEHSPEQFRLIREAYDSVRQFIEIFGAFEDAQPASSFAEAVAGAPSNAAPREPQRAIPNSPSLEEQLDECWQWAVAGDEPKAYCTLEQLHSQTSHDSRINARLYWLLTLAPELDAARSPCDWLAAGLRRSGLSGPLRELYRRELSANPCEALSERCKTLLDAAENPGAMADFVQWRWMALANDQRRVEIMRADLAGLRERILPRDEETWIRLVLAAADQLAFIDTALAADLLARCDRDLQALPHQQLRLSAAFDRYDLLRELAAKRRELLRAPESHEEFLEIIRCSWTTSIEELRPRLMAYLAAIAAGPGTAIKRLDAIKQLASPMLHQFREALSSLEDILDPAADVRSPEEIKELVLSFARETPGSKYADWRPQLLDFCLRELIMPEQVAASLAEHVEFRLSAEQHLSQAAESDLPLVCVCHACRLFWS